MKKYLVLICSLCALFSCKQNDKMSHVLMLANENIIKTNENAVRKNSALYIQMEIQYASNKARTEPFYLKAQQAKKLTEDINGYLTRLRDTVVAGEANISAGESKKLKARIIDYRKAMLDLVDKRYRPVLGSRLGLDTEGPFYNEDSTSEDWETHYFRHTVPRATALVLSMTINEVLNAEFTVLSNLIAEGSFSKEGFSVIRPVIVPKSTYVSTGGNYEADVFLAAIDTKYSPEIWIGSSVDMNTSEISGKKTRVETSNGVGKIKLPAHGPGWVTYSGTIKIVNADGAVMIYPFSGGYIVGNTVTQGPGMHQ